jgi:hypothetical protein
MSHLCIVALAMLQDINVTAESKRKTVDLGEKIAKWLG